MIDRSRKEIKREERRAGREGKRIIVDDNEQIIVSKKDN